MTGLASDANLCRGCYLVPASPFLIFSCMLVDVAITKRMDRYKPGQCRFPVVKLTDRLRICLQYATRVGRSVVFLEPSHSHSSADDNTGLRFHLPVTTSRALVKDSAALICSTCLNITELQLAVLALGTGLGCRGPSVSILGGQDLHIRALVEKARRERIGGTCGLLGSRPFV